MREQRRVSETLKQMLAEAREILLICHVSPDGDTVGSALALKLAFEKLGKKVTVACENKVPAYLYYLKDAEKIVCDAALNADTFDLVMSVDVSDTGRLGVLKKVFEQAKMTCQIDHHETNPYFAMENMVDGKACATGVMAYELIQTLAIPLDTEMARCLYTAVSTDTGNFSYNNTSAEAFDMMGELMQFPINLYQMNRILFRLKPRAQTLLLGRALSQIRFVQNNEVAVMTLSNEDFLACEALPEHAEAIVNYGIDTIGVSISLLARETESGDIKVSLRALAPQNVAEIAKLLGGGGHALAAGVTLAGPMDCAVETLLEAIERHWKA